LTVFLSHNWGDDEAGRDNHARVRKLNDGLKSMGIKTWFDEQGDMQGEIVQAMADGIDQSDVVVICITRAFINKCKKKTGDHCKLEFNYAYNRKGPDLMIPLVMEEACSTPSSWDGPVGAILGSKLYQKFTDDKNFDFDLRRLHGEVLRQCGQLDSAGQTGTPSTEPDTEVDQNELLSLLDPIDFNPEIREHHNKHCEGTRLWVLEAIEAWMQEPNPASNLFVITAVKGIGKSGIAAQLTRKDFVRASFFCTYDDARKRNPKALIRTLVYQLSCKLSEYSAILLRLKREHGWTSQTWRMMGVQELFQTLLCETLEMVTPPSEAVAFVIDALDECEHDGRSELVKLLRSKLHFLPSWVRIIITSRPSSGSGQVDDILSQLKRFSPIELQAGGEQNLSDILLFAQKILEGKLESPDQLERAKQVLAKKSEGSFLFLQFVSEKYSDMEVCSLAEVHKLPISLAGKFARLL
jgi:hypothetical protein